MTDLDAATAAGLLEDVSLNLIRRGADGSLVLTFTPEPPAPPEIAPLVIPLSDVDSISWDRLAKQQARSQVRIRRMSGDLLTFSGRLPDPPG
jgi:hypothetical protein